MAFYSGIVFITLIFGIILVAQLGINILNVTQNKVATGVGQTEVIAKLFEEYEGENQQTIQDSVSNYVDITPEVEAVWVSDLDDNTVWANSDMMPNVENVAVLSFDGEQSISLILEENFEQGITIRDNEIVFNENLFSEVIDLAKKLNMKIVAEGIESREQVDFLTEQECDLIQGYFFAKPMPISEFEEKYKEM